MEILFALTKKHKKLILMAMEKFFFLMKIIKDIKIKKMTFLSIANPSLEKNILKFFFWSTSRGSHAFGYKKIEMKYWIWIVIMRKKKEILSSLSSWNWIKKLWTMLRDDILKINTNILFYMAKNLINYWRNLIFFFSRLLLSSFSKRIRELFYVKM